MTLDDKKHIHVWQDSNHDPRFEFCTRCGAVREKDWSEPSEVDDKKLDEILDELWNMAYSHHSGHKQDVRVLETKTALNRHYGELLMEIIGAAENDMPSWSSGKLAGESKHAKDARIRNQLRAELIASLKQRLGLS